MGPGLVSAAYVHHLVRRFVGSLWPGGPAAADEHWARGQLLPGEAALWDRMSGADQRHALGVARRTVDLLGTSRAPGVGLSVAADGGVSEGAPGAVVPARSDPDGADGTLVAPEHPGGGSAVPRAVVAAALLHDVGKVEAGIGPGRRAVATVVALAVGYERVRAWRVRSGVRGRFGRYLSHDTIGADLLRQVGSDGLTIRWAREHHLPPAQWSVPPAVGTALKSADDD